MTYDVGTLYLDLPWPEKGGGKIKRGADKHYNLMSISEIYNYKKFLPDIKNSHCYLWVTNNFLINGLEALKIYGYRYVTNIVWVKDRIGLGQYFRGQHELLLFGVKGKVPYKVVDGKRQQCPTVFFANRREHSRKPDETYNIIEKVSYPQYFEFFARNKREHWIQYGDEI